MKVDSRTCYRLLIVLAAISGISPLWKLGAQTDIRYDPWDWVTYRHSRFITSVTEGAEYVYFGSDGGILRHHIFGKYWDFPITSSQGLPDNRIDAVYYDLHTHVLWASGPSGLSHSQEQGVRWESVSRDETGLMPGERIVRIGSTSDFLWCQTESQVLKLDHLSGFLVTSYADPPEQDVKWGSAPPSLHRRNHDPVNDFTATGGWMNDLELLRGPHLEEFRISTTFVDRFGDIWVGTWGGPVFHGDSRMKLLEPIPFGPAQTNAEIALKRDDELWLGGIDPSNQYSGITLYSPERRIWDIFRVGYEIMFGVDQIFHGVQVDNEWWFATGDGILIYMPERDSWLPISVSRDLPEERVHFLEFDGEYVYGGTPLGVVRISPSSRNKVSWHVSEKVGLQSVYVVHWDGGNLWMSAESDLWQWNGETDELSRLGTVQEDISENDTGGIIRPVTAIVSSDSVVYFGDELGILSFNIRERRWRRITGESRLAGFEILSLALSANPEEDGTLLWAGTSRGVVVVNLSLGFIRHFKKEDGLASNVVRSIIIDDEVAWFGTPEGLVRFRWRKHLE